MTVRQDAAVAERKHRYLRGEPSLPGRRTGRLVVVGAAPYPPPWVRAWCREAGWRLDARPLPTPVPGRRPVPVPLIADIAELAADPVLVLPPGAAADRLPDVTAALHGLPDDAAVLAAAADAARHLGVRVVLTHGLPLSFAERSVGLPSALDHARLLLVAAVRRLAAEAPGVPVTTQLVRAHPHELVGEDLDTGLLVVGGPRRDELDGLGLVARSALHHAACPTLIVPR